ncbi:HoxN/HupN/NixA family nickel/cobalt transporter [Pedobacter sp. AW31-3R]|uniref:HoxN/HupN/NixA family nickel/cobalt transporter n=1 Tax=Pedobacter sp. AW31-3R TaxID=3445781 RepID=UPI003F9FD9FA
MNFLNISRPLLAGILHSFEPDHITAVSVLASEQAIRKKKISWGVLFRASQWALGHSVTLLIFGGIALAFKESLNQHVTHMSEWAEIAVGPIMILLGIKAIRSNYKMDELVRQNEAAVHHHSSTPAVHLHGKNGEVIEMKPLTRSFWVGMVHGLAGTGGALTTALVISASTIQGSIMVLVLESVGIILTMGIYSYVLISTMSRYLKKKRMVFKWINGIAGLGSATIGCTLLYHVLSGA